MKKHSHREAEPSVEQSEENTLTALRALNSKHYNKYQVTLTPKGKNQSHKTLYKSFLSEITKYKCFKEVFLIAEFENTNHFHGYIYTKDKCQFLNLYRKKHPFDFKLSHREDIEWLHYITKHSTTRYHLEL